MFAAPPAAFDAPSQLFKTRAASSGSSAGLEARAQSLETEAAIARSAAAAIDAMEEQARLREAQVSGEAATMKSRVAEGNSTATSLATALAVERRLRAQERELRQSLEAQIRELRDGYSGGTTGSMLGVCRYESSMEVDTPYPKGASPWTPEIPQSWPGVFRASTG